MVNNVASIVSLKTFPLDEPFAVNAAYEQDDHPNKVNLGIGVYRTEHGQPWPFSAVEQAEQQLHADADPRRHDYLPLQGDDTSLMLSRDLAFSLEKRSATYDRERSRVVSAQTVSGTVANHLGAAYLSRVLAPKTVWIPNICWANHYTIWSLCGVSIQTYPYYNNQRRAFDFQATIKTLEHSAVAGDVVVFHACAHNRTGCDPTRDEWKSTAKLCHRKSLTAFFDMAYQGFASGDVVEDAWAVNHFFNEYPTSEFLVSQSFSKNFVLYGQRAGALHFVFDRDHSNDLTANIASNLCNIIRGEYSMAPRGGSDTVRNILSSPSLTEQWRRVLNTMSTRIKRMRRLLYNQLLKLKTPGDWSCIEMQTGMFSYTGLSESHVQLLREHYHIYMLSSGRMSISGRKHCSMGQVI